ncbi:hypothetical protein QFC19_001318 [Naganishia cerealis]|uniref:Uncharacterized protein n=1 Tax=Naganishia cerealis TaxID=610337 RepID=A0ACC2WIW5_9TREE|nr:hypothetical protein QFC19_001318 [Naganishia cerealis]
MPRPRTTLPALLAQLPAYGQGALVQPAAWAERFPNSFYKITRTRLRVKAEGGTTQYLSRSAPTTDEVKGKARENSVVPAEEEDFEDDAFGGDDMEIGQVDSAVETPTGATAAGDLTGKKAHGQAWGVLFWNGQPKFPFKNNYSPASTTADAAAAFTPQSKIRRALSDSWRAVDVTSLPSATLRAVETLESGKRRDWYARREQVPVMNLSVKDLAGLRRRQERGL